MNFKFERNINVVRVNIVKAPNATSKTMLKDCGGSSYKKKCLETTGSLRKA
jgi:hypothetical protein